MRQVEVYVTAEFEALSLLEAAGVFYLTTGPCRAREAAEKIILLAERIKAQRAVAAIHAPYDALRLMEEA